MTIHLAQRLTADGIRWSDIDTVLLDMDGTLLDLQFDNEFWNQVVPAQFAQHRGIDLQTAQRQLAPVFEREQGQLNWYCLDFWSAELGFDIAALKRELAEGIRWRKSARDFLDRLRASHCQVLLITNAHPETLRIKMERVDLAPWFDHLISSHDLGAAKESQQFWLDLQQRHPFDRDRTLFIDDSETVLTAAEDFGVAHLITLLQPDSSQPLRDKTRYPAIHHFDEIFEGLPSVEAT